jgi:hypothetical protein
MSGKEKEYDLAAVIQPSAPPAETFQDDVPGGDGTKKTTISPEDTIPLKVNYDPSERKYTDIWFGVVYALSYAAYLACGIYIVTQAQPRYQTLSDSNDDGVRTISDHHMEDALQCCMSSDGGEIYGSVCWTLRDAMQSTDDDAGAGRRLQAGNSKFNGDEGMFDAFIDAPEIIVGLLSVALGSAVLWFVLLRFFAKPIVIIVEFVKMGIFIAMGIYQEETSTRIVCFLVAAGIAAYAWYFRKQILFAAQVIAHSAKAMKANPSVFIGGIFVKGLFAANAAIFLTFFSKSFEVSSIKQHESCYTDYYGVSSCTKYCDFESPGYVSSMNVYLSLSYLWTLLLLHHFRLSIVATIVGSWYLHPEDKPTILTAIRNIPKSFGTLSISSLIATIAEEINRRASRSCWRSWVSPCVCITVPLDLFLCGIAYCFHACIQMLTKFAVICHVFTGLSFMGSAKKVFKIMSRHFTGGFVTELTSRSVLTLGSYVFSVGIAMLTWVWVNDRFNCESMIGQPEERLHWIVYVLIIVFNVWYPIIGIYVLIIANSYLQKWERSKLDEVTDYNETIDNYNHVWIPPLAAAFVGCIAMMLFEFLSNIFLDIIDTVFLCFAIKMDHNLDNENDQELKSLIKQVPGYIEASHVEIVQASNDIEGAVPVAMPVPEQSTNRNNATVY